jgi:hypothetical protein
MYLAQKLLRRQAGTPLDYTSKETDSASGNGSLLRTIILQYSETKVCGHDGQPREVIAFRKYSYQSILKGIDTNSVTQR